ncbi:MAG: hypothetical protein ABSG73_13295 [Candidatus Aminicenantales bacterium]|jgi:hypothetical protein
MTIYIIKHPTPGFRGCVFGVDFHNGQGSTSDLTQLCDLLDVGKGYKIIGPLSDEQKADLLAFKKARQPFKDAQKAFAKQPPAGPDWTNIIK